MNFNGQVNIPNGYSMDHFEYNEAIKVRQAEDSYRKEYKLSVIIPVYNNGKYLDSSVSKV